MTTIINNPGETSDNNSSIILTVIMLAILIFALFYWGIPLARNAKSGTNVNLNVPDEVDINVNQLQ